MHLITPLKSLGLICFFTSDILGEENETDGRQPPRQRRHRVTPPIGGAAMGGSREREFRPHPATNGGGHGGGGAEGGEDAEALLRKLREL